MVTQLSRTRLRISTSPAPSERSNVTSAGPPRQSGREAVTEPPTDPEEAEDNGDDEIEVLSEPEQRPRRERRPSTKVREAANANIDASQAPERRRPRPHARAPDHRAKYPIPTMPGIPTAAIRFPTPTPTWLPRMRNIKVPSSISFRNRNRPRRRERAPHRSFHWLQHRPSGRRHLHQGLRPGQWIGPVIINGKGIARSSPPTIRVTITLKRVWVRTELLRTLKTGPPKAHASNHHLHRCC